METDREFGAAITDDTAARHRSNGNAPARLSLRGILAQITELLARNTAAVEAKAEPAELLNTAEAGRICGLAARTMYTYDAAGRVPKPIRLSDGCIRWRRSELLAWIVAGCPRREMWHWPD